MNTRCFICGNPCKLWDDNSHNACITCASDIFKKRYPNLESSPNDGDGFPKASCWDQYVLEVKKDWQSKHNAACYCCGKNCKDWNNPYSSYHYVNVCSTCWDKMWQESYGDSDSADCPDGNGFTRDSHWQVIANTIKTKLNTVVPVGDNLSEALQKLSDLFEKEKVVEETMKIETWDLVEGDKVELRINDSSEDDGFIYLEAIFIARQDNGTGIFALEEEYHSDEYDSQSWYDQNIDGDKLRDIARKYKVKHLDYDNVWTVEDSSNCETKINKILKSQVTKKDKDDKAMPIDRNTGYDITWGQTFIKDSGKAAIRSGATLGIDGLKAGITKALAAQGIDGPGVKAVMAFFDSDFGDACLRGGLGYTLLGMPIPYIQENEYAQQISEELRVSGLSGGMDQGIAMVKEFIAPALMEAFKNTPIMKGIEESAAKARVHEGVAPQRIATPTLPLPVADEHEELEVVADPFKAPKQARM
jgi:hypothetical protein